MGHEDANLSGCITNNNGVAYKHPMRNLGDINDLPIPNFKPFRINDYDSYIMPTSFGRGCVAKCSFCFETVYWKKFRVKSPELALQEIVELVEKYRIKFFSINDSLMNGNHKFLEEFCDRLIQTKLGITFFGYCRVDKKLTVDLLLKMKKAGCRDIAYGVESGSSKILKLMKKGVVKENIYPTLKRTHDVGINVTTCFIVGHPGEGLRDYIETCLLIYKCRKFINELNLSVFNPEYETQMMENPEKYHLVFRDEKWVSTEFWNQPKILDLKYFIISKFWNRYRGVKASPTKWLYKRPSEK